MAKKHPGHVMHDGHPEEHLHKDVHKGHMHPEHEHGAHHDGRERHGRGAHHEGAQGAPHEMRGNRGMGEHEPTGRDAAEARPFLIPDYELLPRDDSGGPEFMPYTQEWGDGGYTTGPKMHLSPQGPRVPPRGGGDTPEEGDEESRAPRGRGEPRWPGEETEGVDRGRGMSSGRGRRAAGY